MLDTEPPAGPNRGGNFVIIIKLATGGNRQIIALTAWKATI